MRWTSAAWHALFWLVAANAIGVLLSILLLCPALNRWLFEWTYGRWIMVHINLELYVWTSLRWARFLFMVYRVERGAPAKWCRPVLCLWSAALGVGAYSWLSGHSSGKLFLDWSGSARILAGDASSSGCCSPSRLFANGKQILSLRARQR